MNCWDALGMIAETFETEWWIDGHHVNLTRCERGDAVSLGYGQGLTKMALAENSNDVKFFTRLIPLGSTRNIDRSKYGFSRLQLPGRQKYVEQNILMDYMNRWRKLLSPKFTPSVSAKCLTSAMLRRRMRMDRIQFITSRIRN